MTLFPSIPRYCSLNLNFSVLKTCCKNFNFNFLVLSSFWLTWRNSLRFHYTIVFSLLGVTQPQTELLLTSYVIWLSCSSFRFRHMWSTKFVSIFLFYIFKFYSPLLFITHALHPSLVGLLCTSPSLVCFLISIIELAITFYYFHLNFRLISSELDNKPGVSDFLHLLLLFSNSISSFLYWFLSYLSHFSFVYPQSCFFIFWPNMLPLFKISSYYCDDVMSTIMPNNSSKLHLFY